jgi:hypothetical protein
MANMDRLEEIVARLPDAERVDVAEWGDHPTFRVRGKNFVFCDQEARHLSLKLPPEEATAVVATDADVHPAGYGLGRHGWVFLDLVPPIPATIGGTRSRNGSAAPTSWSHRNAWPRASSRRTTEPPDPAPLTGPRPRFTVLRLLGTEDWGF